MPGWRRTRTRPIAACSLLLFAQIIDDSSARNDLFPQPDFLLINSVQHLFDLDLLSRDAKVIVAQLGDQFVVLVEFNVSVLKA